MNLKMPQKNRLWGTSETVSHDSQLSPERPEAEVVLREERLWIIKARIELLLFVFYKGESEPLNDCIHSIQLNIGHILHPIITTALCWKSLHLVQLKSFGAKISLTGQHMCYLSAATNMAAQMDKR